MTTIQTTGSEPLTHAEAMDLQAQELACTIDMLRSLDASDWAARTDCPQWDVRQMYQRVLGACEAGASMRENVHQLRAAYSYRKRNGGPLEAALSAVQTGDRADLVPTEIVAKMEAVAPKTVRGRTRTPRLVRNHGKPFVLELEGPVGGTFVQDPESPEVEHLTLDAVEFCRALAGRSEATGLLKTIVPF